MKLTCQRYCKERLWATVRAVLKGKPLIVAAVGIRSWRGNWSHPPLIDPASGAGPRPDGSGSFFI